MSLFPEKFQWLYLQRDIIEHGVPYYRTSTEFWRSLEAELITAKSAAHLIGVTPKQFARLLSKYKFRKVRYRSVDIEHYVFYRISDIRWMAKVHKLENIRISLRRQDISNHRRKVLERKLYRKKLEYLAAIGWFDEDAIDLVIEKLPNLDRMEEVLFLSEFGPDDESEWIKLDQLIQKLGPPEDEVPPIEQGLGSGTKTLSDFQKEAMTTSMIPVGPAD